MMLNKAIAPRYYANSIRASPYFLFYQSKEEKKREREKKKEADGVATRRDALTLESRSVGETSGGSQYKRVQRDPRV